MTPRTRAAVMSLLLPGLGQIYLGRGRRALIWFAGLVALYLIAGSNNADAWIAPALTLTLGVASAADALVVGRTSGPGS